MRVVIYKDIRGEHRWRVLARNGRIIAESGESYKRRCDLTSTLDTLRKGLKAAKVCDEE